MITGGASGIGAAFAELAVRRYDRVILIDRNEEALAEMHAALDSAAAPVEYLCVDLATEAGQTAAFERVERCDDLMLLVNNAGFGHPGGFAELPVAVHRSMVDVHVMTTALLCRAALPGMYERARGDIVNVGALMDYVIINGNAMYGSTKAWMSFFTASIRNEARWTGVNVQLLRPGYTKTALHEVGPFTEIDPSVIPEARWSTPQEVARASMRGLDRRKAVVVPGVVNTIIYHLLKRGLIPRRVIAGRVM